MTPYIEELPAPIQIRRHWLPIVEFLKNCAPRWAVVEECEYTDENYKNVSGNMFSKGKSLKRHSEVIETAVRKSDKTVKLYARWNEGN